MEAGRCAVMSTHDVKFAARVYAGNRFIRVHTQSTYSICRDLTN